VSNNTHIKLLVYIDNKTQGILLLEVSNRSG